MSGLTPSAMFIYYLNKRFKSNGVFVACLSRLFFVIIPTCVQKAGNDKNNMTEDMNRRPDNVMDKGKPIERRLLHERIGGQITGFINLLESYNGKLPAERQRCPEDYAYLRNFFPDFVSDRNARAEEVNTDEYKETLKVAEKLLPMTPFSVMCMDGRVKPIHVFGFSAGVGGSIRVPGGLLKEFFRGKDGELALDGKSNFAELLAEALKRNSSSLAEIFDSHYACAARKGEEQSRGGIPDDEGLYSDVLHKKEMVQATRKFILENYDGDSTQVALIQSSFNPITGFLYMGLETDAALAFAREEAGRKEVEKAAAEGRAPETAVPAYSKDVLAKLIDEGKIISTGALIDHPLIRKAFDDHFFAVSWKNNYVDTATRFWTGLSEMKDDLLPLFEDSLKRIYPELAIANKKTKKELEERAMLLMSNAYNAYLHNSDHSESAYLAMDDHAYEKEKHYEYDAHIEQGIKISEGGYPPYDIPMFVIFSGDEDNMPANIELASGIVRDNRIKGRVDYEKAGYGCAEDFAKAPVAIVMQEIVRDTRLTEADWETLEQIDWGDLPDKEWDKMTPAEFANYLAGKGTDRPISLTLANSLENLRRKMAKIFDKNSVTSAHLIEQLKVVLPVICDQDRKTHAVIPFVKLGY
jgi:hypothetical protein